MTYAARFEAQTRALARAAGITLTPAGRPLFARDIARYAEIRGRETRTPAEIAEDLAAQKAIDDAADVTLTRAETDDIERRALAAAMREP